MCEYNIVTTVSRQHSRIIRTYLYTAKQQQQQRISYFMEETQTQTSEEWVIGAH